MGTAGPVALRAYSRSGARPRYLTAVRHTATGPSPSLPPVPSQAPVVPRYPGSSPAAWTAGLAAHARCTMPSPSRERRIKVA